VRPGLLMQHGDRDSIGASERTLRELIAPYRKLLHKSCSVDGSRGVAQQQRTKQSGGLQVMLGNRYCHVDSWNSTVITIRSLASTMTDAHTYTVDKNDKQM